MIKGHLGLLSMALLVLFTVRVNADGVTWDSPVRLTPEESVVQYSAIAVDLRGGVHVFWANKPETGVSANQILYRYRDQQEWTETTDVLVGPEWDAFSRPAVLCDRANRLHLLWNSTQGLYYSSALADEASDPRAWLSPVRVMQADAMGPTDLAISPDGILHVVYTRYRSATNLMYTRSEDSGATWATPQAISTIVADDKQIPDAARLTIDRRGILHVVWSESYPPEYLGRQILYSQSLDNGLTWSAPQPLSGVAQDSAWNALPNIVVDSEDQLQVVWACGDPVMRCYRSSIDHGVSWTGVTEPLFQQLIGSSGRDAMAADPHGNVFWAGSLRFPQAFYFSTLTDGAWRAPPQALVTEGQFGGLASAHFPQMVIGEGNQLHLVLVESDGGPLWYLHGQSSYPRVEAEIEEAMPTPTMTPTAAPINEPTATLPTPTPQIRPLATPEASSSGISPLLISTAAVTAFLLLALAVSRKRNRS